MEELSHEDVLQILRMIEESDVEYLEIEIGGTRIVADRSGTGPRGAAVPAPQPVVAPQVAPAPTAAPAPAVAVQPTSPAAATPTAAPAPAAAAVEEGLVTVVAPVVGVFYRAPEPGAAPYCAVGDVVAAGATLGLVEVMKMFNSVTTDVAGEIVEILAENEAFVEFGQPLFRIRPGA